MEKKKIWESNYKQMNHTPFRSTNEYFAAIQPTSKMSV